MKLKSCPYNVNSQSLPETLKSGGERSAKVILLEVVRSLFYSMLFILIVIVLSCIVFFLINV